MTETVEIDILARTEKAVSGMADFVKGIAAAYLSYEGLKKLIEGSLDSFFKAEQADTKLSTALKLTAQYSKDNMEALTGMAKALSFTTTYSIEATKSAATLLMQLGNLSVSGVEKLTPHIQDFAASLGIDLVTASELVGKTLGGTTNMLGRYGIVIKDTKDKSAEFNEILDQMTTKFGGVAAAVGQTAGGQVEIFKNQIDELKVHIGALLAVGLKPALNTLNTEMLASEAMKASVSTLNNVQLIQSYMDAIESRRGPNVDIGGAYAKAGQAKLYELSQRMKELNAATQDQANFANDAAAALKREAEAAADLAEKAAFWKDYKSPFSYPSFMGDPGGMRVTEKTPDAAKVTASLAPAVDLMKMFSVNAAAASINVNGIVLNSEDVKVQWAAIGSEVVKVGDAIGKAISSGDWASALQGMAQELTGLIEQLAIAAAASAMLPGGGGLPVALFWLGIAGVAAIGGGIIGAGGSGGHNSAGLPHYASGTDYVPHTGLAVVHQGEQIIPAGRGGGGKVMHVHVYGGVWQADNLAQAIAAATGKW